MLARAHEQCIAETSTVSMAVSTVVLPPGALTYVRVFTDNRGWY